MLVAEQKEGGPGRARGGKGSQTHGDEGTKLWVGVTVEYEDVK